MSSVITLRTPKSLHQDVRALAEAEGVSWQSHTKGHLRCSAGGLCKEERKENEKANMLSRLRN